MPDPFVQPEEPTAAEAVEAISDDLDVFDDWMDRYAHLIEMGRKLPPFPETWQDDAHRVPGCQSKVWMEAEERDDRLWLAGASDAAIVSGLVALLLRVYSGRPPAEILATDPVFLKDFGLLEALSTNRGSGVASMARRIRDVASKATRKPPDPLRRHPCWPLHRRVLRGGGDQRRLSAPWFADRGLTAAQIGEVLGLSALLRVGVIPLWGQAADAIGHRRAALAGAALVAMAAALLLPAMPLMAPLFAAACVQGVAAATLTPLGDAVALPLAAAGRLDYGRTRAWGSVSYMGAAAAGGALLGVAGTGAVPLILAVGYGFTAVFGLLMPEAPHAAPVPHERASPFRLPAFRLAVLASGLIQGAHAAYYSFAALRWRAAGSRTGSWDC